MKKLSQLFCKHDYKLISAHKDKFIELYACNKCNLYKLSDFGEGKSMFAIDPANLESMGDPDNWRLIK